MWKPNPEIYFHVVNLFPQASCRYSLIFAGLIAVTGITLFLCLTHKTNKTDKTNRLKNGIRFTSAVIGVAAFAYLIAGIQTIMTASSHGMYQNNLSWKTITESIQTTPKEDKLPENLTGCIILYYRFGCSDCEAVYPAMSEFFDEYDDVYWISTRSKQGKTLLETYPVSHVPTGVYITDSGTGIYRTMYFDSTEEVLFHETHAEELLQLYENSH